MTKTVPFLAIQFSISMQFNFIYSLHRTLSGATSLGNSGPGSDGNEGYSAFPKTPALQEPWHQIVRVISRTLVGGRSYPFAVMQLVYSMPPPPAYWATQSITISYGLIYLSNRFVKKSFIFYRNIWYHIHIYQPLRSDRIWHKVNFYAEFNRFEFRVFLLLD